MHVSSMDLMQSPARIGPYELLCHIATGGMAETFVAIRRGPGDFEQRVCLKRVRADKIGNTQFVEQFEREARIAASLRHANIVQVIDFGVFEGEPFLAFEFVEGVDFGRLIRDPVTSRSVDAALVTHVAVETAIALEFAHRAGVLHRDVSPCNILISAEGELKLADFGVAKALGRSDPETAVGKFKGKVAYVAPEYVRTSRAGPTGDLYSLGITLYEALCGYRPYDGATALETFERAARGVHVALLDRNPALPARLCEVVEALIRPDPAGRPDGATTLLAQLQELPRTGRRELTSLVKRLQRYTAQPQDHVPTSRLVVDESSPAQPVEAMPTRVDRRRLLFATVLVATFLSVLALGVVALSRRTGEVAATKRTETRARKQPPQAAVTVAPKVEPTAVQCEPVPPRKVESSSDPSGWNLPNARGTLHVIVFPYGQVWIDGARAGQSPLTVDLTPGEHHLRVVSPKGRQLRTVRLEPGSKERVVFR
jgi:eukaryotic-like serine/threonine-protein kinase